MLVLTVSFEKKCDFVGFLISRNIPEISGMSERFTEKKSIVEIYAETNIKKLVSELLAEYILGPFRLEAVRECISLECPFISDEEKNIILEGLSFSEYEPDIKAELDNYIKDNDYIDIPGFVRFRLPTFSRNVTADTARACENFLKKREYEEMVSLLRYHISCSTPFGTTKITFCENGDFSILYPDGKMTEVKNYETGANAALGMLMVTIPEKIKIYNREFAKEGMLSSIEDIFGDSVEYFE